MRRYRSYLSLMARSTLYKELLLILGMAVVEGALFFYQSQKQITFLAAYTADREEVWMSRALTIGEMVENARLSLVWFGGLLLLSLLLIRTAGRWRDYTLNRLGLSRVQGNLRGFLCAAVGVPGGPVRGNVPVLSPAAAGGDGNQTDDPALHLSGPTVFHPAPLGQWTAVGHRRLCNGGAGGVRCRRGTADASGPPAPGVHRAAGGPFLA